MQTLIPLPLHYAICRLDCQELSQLMLVGKPHLLSPLFSLTVTTDEISLICTQEKAKALQHLCEGHFDYGWKAFRLAGTFDFGQIGILAKISTVLAHAEVGIMAVSTFDTDYILVKQEHWAKAQQATSDAGYLWGEEA